MSRPARLLSTSLAGRLAGAAAVCALIAALQLLGAADARAAAPFTTGFYDQGAYTSSSSDIWFGRSNDAGAGIVRIQAFWSQLAPGSRPVDPSSSADPAYDWSYLDDAVRGANAHGLEVLLSADRAPAWAEGPNRPASAPAGTWRPDPAEYGLFAHALAQRYSGAILDPDNPTKLLPRVRYYQAWNEPNLSTYLTPQWSGKTAVSPLIYRQLLNAFYDGVKGPINGADQSNFVVGAGTAPFGDLGTGGRRISPLLFARTLYCLSGKKLKTTSCPDPAHLDAISHHPYSVGGPRWKAYNADDASVPDVWKVVRVLRRAESTGRVLPTGRKRVWATEISWDSSPPDPQGVPAATQARWLEESMYVLWSQGVDTMIWYLIQDAAPTPSYAQTYQSGVYLRNGTAKPSLTAFRFPFVTERRSKSKLRAWGRALEDGTVSIQVKGRHGWHTVKRLDGKADGVFMTKLSVKGPAKLRAQAPWGTSLIWPQR
jgi:hypothetical protein